MSKLNNLENDAADLVGKAHKAGADACDVVVAKSDSLSISVRDGKTENSNRSENDLISIRVFSGKKVASVTANSKTDPSKLAERAVAMAKVSPEDPYQGLVDRDQLFDTSKLAAMNSDLDLFDPTHVDPDRLEKDALECEAAGLGVEGVTKSMGAGASWSSSGFVLATSSDFVGSFERSGFSLSASMVAGEGTGMERDYDFDSAIHQSDLKSAEEIGQSAGEKVVKRVGPRQVKSGSYPVVCDRRISTGILGTLMGAVNGSSIARKTSFLRDEMGKQITSSGINIIDDPLMKRRMGSKLFDGEGIRTEKLSFVENGVLQQWVLDSATARELNLATNGRAARGETGIRPSTTNCYMEAGSVSFKDMISGIKEGLYLTETIGHGINMVTGDYSKGAAGFWIVDGEIAFPVAEITVAGNLKDMFLNMTPANDLEFRYGTNAPTLLIDGMTIGGN